MQVYPEKAWQWPARFQTHECRGGGQGVDWVMVRLDPACPEPDTELQLRAAVLLILTWDIKARSGIR